MVIEMLTEGLMFTELYVDKHLSIELPQLNNAV